MTEIRAEGQQDYDAVRIVNDLAFGQPEEGRIVEQIRKVCPDTLSLVAHSGDDIVGHIFFSPATIAHQSGEIVGMGLAPMAVLPALQNQGIGSLLVKEGLRQVKERGYPFVIVLGHAHYYPRFGFERASTHGMASQWEGVPDEAFMALILDKAAMAGVAGVAEYRPEFDAAM